MTNQPEATTTTVLPLGEAEIATLLGRHSPDNPNRPKPICNECEDFWPCPEYRAVANLDAERTAREQAEQAASAEADGVTRLSNLLARERQARQQAEQLHAAAQQHIQISERYLGQEISKERNARKWAEERASYWQRCEAVWSTTLHDVSAEFLVLLGAERQAREWVEGMLSELTIGGSEFVDNPQRCFEYARDRISKGIEYGVALTIAERERDAAVTARERAEAALTTERGRGERFAKAVKRACRYIPKGGDGLAGDMLLIALAVWTKPAPAPASSQAAPHEPPPPFPACDHPDSPENTYRRSAYVRRDGSLAENVVCRQCWNVYMKKRDQAKRVAAPHEPPQKGDG